MFLHEWLCMCFGWFVEYESYDFLVCCVEWFEVLFGRGFMSPDCDGVDDVWVDERVVLLDHCLSWEDFVDESEGVNEGL